ncbi:MAG: aldo/keto reductase [Rickettsiales bacterium]
MEYTLIGKSDLKVSRLGFGCWQLGGHGWQDIDQKEIEKAIHSALDMGINFFDTADIYGLGESEKNLARTLAKHPLGKNAIVASKFAVRQKNDGSTYYDNSKEWMFEAVEGSLKRLERETIDLYQLHWHDGKRPLDDIFTDLEILREQGKIRWYGISNISPLDIDSVDIDSDNTPEGLVSFTMKYSLAGRENEQEIKKATEEKNLGFISWGSLAQGLLSGKYNRNSVFSESDVRSRESSLFSQDNWDYFEKLLDKLQKIATDNNKNMAQTALRFVLDNIPKSIVLTGIKNNRQLTDNAGCLNWKLGNESLRELKDISAMENTDR